MSKSQISLDKHGSWIWKDNDAREPNLVVFIHGYTGNPEATWAKFPDLIRQAGRDLSMASRWLHSATSPKWRLTSKESTPLQGSY